VTLERGRQSTRSSPKSLFDPAASFVETRGTQGRPGSLKDRERNGAGDKGEKSVNGRQIFHWEVSTAKTRLPFQECRVFRKISSGTNQKVVFHLHPNWNFRNFLINVKRSSAHGFHRIVLNA